MLYRESLVDVQRQIWRSPDHLDEEQIDGEDDEGVRWQKGGEGEM